MFNGQASAAAAQDGTRLCRLQAVSGSACWELRAAEHLSPAAYRFGSPAPRGITIHPERGNTGHARAVPVRRVQPNVIPLVERGFVTDETA